MYISCTTQLLFIAFFYIFVVYQCIKSMLSLLASLCIIHWCISATSDLQISYIRRIPVYTSLIFPCQPLGTWSRKNARVQSPMGLGRIHMYQKKQERISVQPKRVKVIFILGDTSILCSEIKYRNGKIRGVHIDSCPQLGLSIWYCETVLRKRGKIFLIIYQWTINVQKMLKVVS